MNSSIQKYTDENCKKNPVIFTGSVNNVWPYYQKCDIGVFPSSLEGLPVALLEKMAIGLPVIVSDIPQLTNIVSHMQTGLVFKLGDANDFAEKLRLLISNPDLRTKLGENAREYIAANYGSFNVAAEYEKLYKNILSARL